MADPRVTIEPPARQARLGGLFPVAEIRDGVEHMAAARDVQYVAEPCAVGFHDTGYCYSNHQQVGNKSLHGIDAAVGVVPNFAGYYGVECWMGEQELEDYRRRAREALLAVEGRYVESKFNGWIFDAPVTAATGIQHAFGAAEVAADRDYIGRPVIHISRDIATLARAENLVQEDRDGNMWTVNGTPVAASGFYTAPTGLVITGAVTVLRSDIVYAETNVPNSNKAYSLAERVYGIAVDCGYRRRFNWPTA